VNSLDNLVEELNSSNKINTAKFFENISSQIKILWLLEVVVLFLMRGWSHIFTIKG
jgi:hypothetical protein